ncbi:DNA-formamidopyrimidine glycosylase family protein [Dyadobacter sp. 3J3]|uniref:DNA-formamidopyrimidine glycosylase family protein n=1 Tax=Dyadobacter sp. 3J3 TaxID=2606600 RepID=UPI0013581166|nr:DNA-formamidopyrimidine glycosylase family protein [Dyadobacter sp. 3J3]
MPEIPELNVIAKTLQEYFKGEKINKIEFPWTKKLNVPEDEFREAVKGAVLKKVDRDGKEIQFHLDNGNVIGIHLMLTGKMYLLPTDEKISNPIFNIMFSNGGGICVTDNMGQARSILNPESTGIPDVLSNHFTLSYLASLLSNSNSKIKQILTDQNKIKGLGNAYVDEILWNVKISPFSISKRVPDDKVKELFDAIPEITNAASQAIEQRQDPEDIFAMKNKEHRFVHNSKLTHTMDGEEIIIGKIGQSKTYYTESQIQY